MAYKLIDNGADVNAQNENGRNALFTSIYQNCTDIALYLLDKGARWDFEDSVLSNFTLLHYACFQGIVKVILLFINKINNYYVKAILP